MKFLSIIYTAILLTLGSTAVGAYFQPIQTSLGHIGQKIEDVGTFVAAVGSRAGDTVSFYVTRFFGALFDCLALLLNPFYALLTAAVFAVAFSMLTGVSPLASFAIALTLSFALGFLKHQSRFENNSALQAGLLKEIWTTQLMEKFYSIIAHLSRSTDMTEFVEYNTINLADAGVDPTVLVNNTTYPIPFAERSDNPLTIPLDYFDTEGQVVRDPEAIQLAYNKLESVLKGHRNALAETTAAKATHAWSPTSDGAFNPVFATTGAARTGEALKAMKFADLAKMQRHYNQLKVPVMGRVCVLDPKHQEDLQNESVALFNAFANLKTGEILQLCGFDMYTSQLAPTFNKSTEVKKAFGAAAAPSTDTHSSLFYHEGEVMRADGEVRIDDEERRATEKGVIISAHKRFIALPIRSKYRGAIFAPAS